MPYHPSNLNLQPYAHWRVKLLARVASLLGIHFRIGAIPYGAPYDRELWDAWRESRISREFAA